MSLILKYDLGNPHRLPVGYTPLAYIESTGTLYINTGILGVSNMKILITLSWAEIINNYLMVTGWANCTLVGINSSGYWHNWTLTASENIIKTNDKYLVLLNIINDTSTLTQGSINLESSLSNIGKTNNLCIFGVSNGSSISYYSKAKVYNYKIYTNNQLIRDFIPAKNSSGVVGLFDCVSQTFFTNSGNGSFIAGPEVVVLPYEYLLVEYLEALPRSSYIDTGIKPSANLGTELGYCGIGLGSAENIFFGASNLSGYAGNPNYCMETDGSTLNIAFNTGYLSVSFTANSGQRYKLQLNINGDKQYKIDGVVKITFSANDNLPTNYNLFLFKRSVSGGGNDSYNVYTTRLEYCKMWNGTTLVRNMIPCYRRSDLKPGMYDTVNNVFYTNSGSGEFILGPVVEESSRQLEYNNAGSNYIGKPTNVHHSTSNPSTTQINEGSGDFSGGATIRTTIPALNNSYSISWWANGVYGDTMMWSINYLNPLYHLCVNTGDGYQNPWYKPGTTTQITAPSNNVWHHFVITGDGSSNKLYVDGVHYGTSKTYKSCSGTALGLNYYLGLAAYQWNGKMYDFRIYNNVLTADEVLKIYKGGL